MTASVTQVLRACFSMRLGRALLLVLLTLGATASGGAGQEVAYWTPEVAAAADSLISASMESEGIPGAAIVVVENGRVVQRRGFGLADRDRGIPVEVDSTLFRIGSITKALTALALTGLVAREGIDLREPVERYIPPGLVPESPVEEPIQIRHLLTHTGGFDQTGLGRRVDDPSGRPSIEAFLAEHLVRVRPPGEVAVYDTYGITLAGYLIERIGGLSYADYMRSQVFLPLGMTRTWVEAPPEERGSLAVGYGLEDSEWLPQDYEWYVTLPASAVDATAADMGRLLVALLGDGGALLPADLARRVRTEVQFEYGAASGAFSWGLWDERRNGWRGLHHGGVMAGYSSELHLVPEAGIGLFLAYNRDPETGPPPRLRDALIDLLYDRVLPDRAEAVPPDAAQPIDTDGFAGAYAFTGGCFTCAEGQGWGIGWQEVSAPESGIVAIGERRWLAIDSTGFRTEGVETPLRFLSDASGRVRYMVRGPNSWVRMDESLLEVTLGENWRDQPPAPLVALVQRANRRWEEAADAYASLAARDPTNGAYAYWEGYAALNAGEPERALRAMARAREAGKWPAWSRYYEASAHAAMADHDRALALLEQSLDEGFDEPGLVRSEPWWDPLRDDPRFRALAARWER